MTTNASNQAQRIEQNGANKFRRPIFTLWRQVKSSYLFCLSRHASEIILIDGLDSWEHNITVLVAS